MSILSHRGFILTVEQLFSNCINIKLNSINCEVNSNKLKTIITTVEIGPTSVRKYKTNITRI